MIHVRIIFQVLRLSFFKNSLHRKNRAIVSNVIVRSNDCKNWKKYSCENICLGYIICKYDSLLEI